jgi:alkylation response protein AidB-like acyl-CoA dehydrogenase
MVPRDHPGLALDPCPAFGPGACRVRLDRARVGALHRLAAGAAGHALFAAVLDRARLRQAAYLCGMALGALEEAVRHASTRRQFGRRLVELQAVQLGLAELVASLDAARLRVRHTAWALDSGVTATLAAVESLAMAAELALDATRAAVHVHGARGMAAEWPVHRYYRWAIVEANVLGSPRRLWEEAGRARLAGREACA